jgi:TolB-like protein/class 3 adenylate cyclase/Tfp pilus assembly protein PilF
MAEERVQRRLAAILSADVVGYSRLMGIDEAGTLARLKAMRRDLVDPQIAAHSGRTFKLMGDGALVEFASAVDAVTCAIEVQKQVKEHNSGSPEDSQIQFRIGINVGDIIVDGDDIYGDGVNVAARIQALADPGGIYISRGAAEQVRDKVPIKIETRGEQTVKNIARPIEVFCIIADDRDAIVVAVHKSETGVQLPIVAEKPSIAVLAFNNMSGDAEQEYFSDGISEDIITDLSKLSELRVIARNSTFTYKGKAVDVKQVGRELGVRYVLEGSVRKAGNRVRVTGQLIDAADGAHIWADRFDRDLTDIFAVQDELTQEIISALKVKLTPEKKDRLVRKGTLDVEGYNLFLRGREHAFLHTRSGNIEARNLLERAVTINADFAAALAFIAFTHVNDYINGWADLPEHSLQTGLEIAERAVQLDEEEPQAHFVVAVALLWRREHDRALAEVQRCVAIAPNFAEGHLVIAHILIYSGNAAAAINKIDAYMQLDPLYKDIALYFLAEARISLGQFDEAVAALKQRLDRNPNSETSYALLASCYGHLGKIAEARAAWAEVMKIAPDFSIERRRRILPFKNPDVFEHRIEGMRKAGIPV